jgi:hypothetical protein
MTPNETAQTSIGVVPTFLPAAPAQRLLRSRPRARPGTSAPWRRYCGWTGPRSTGCWVASRLRYDTADRIAVGLGRHPSELWPSGSRPPEQVDR